MTAPAVPQAAMPVPLLSARAVGKTYGGMRALDGVDLDLHRGRIHALIGANGAGKSTLCRILAGVESPDTGGLYMDGAPVRFASVREAAAHGIAIVHQELSLFPNLSVAENLFVGCEPRSRWGLVDREAQHRQCSAVLARLGLEIDPHTLVGELSVGRQQLVEIARALMRRCRMLMMDEPTSALSQQEIPRLFEQVRALAAQGVCVVYISHRLDELLRLCDDLSVLRDGRVCGHAACADIDAAWIVERMTGARTHDTGASAGTDVQSAGGCVLEVNQLSLPANTTPVALDGISLKVHAGEIVGVYGLMGSGRSELLQAIFGVYPDAGGQMRLHGCELSGLDPAARVKHGIALLPEDRQRDALIAEFSVLHNISVSALRRLAVWGWLAPAREHAAAAAMGRAVQLKSPGLSAPVHALSGGNQQKLVLARCLLGQPRLLLLDEPTRGVDVAAKAEISAQIRLLAEQGIAVIFTSSEAGEILALAQRVCVLARGRMVSEAAVTAWDEARLTRAAAAPMETQGEIA